MAVDQDLLDQIASTVADLYREVEASLITVIADELKKGLDAPTAEVKLDAVTKLRSAAQAVYQRLQKTKSAAVREAIRAAYRDGHASALTGLPVSKAIKDDAKTALKQVPNAAIIENLAAALHRDLGRVEGNILRAPIDAYRAVQAGTAARIATGTATRRQASQAAWQRLMDRGIVGFTDRAGRQWRLSSYAEMIGRTNAQRAMVAGQMDRLAEVGIDLVYISDNVQECKRCRPFESKVLRRNAGPIGKIKVEHGTRDGEQVVVDVLDTLDGARAKGLFHPNCFPGTVLASAPSGIRAADSRWYEGELVVIHTASGNELPVTPNHPVLTPEGWVAAGSLKVGQHVLRHRSDIERVDGVSPGDQQVPAPISEIFDALRKSSSVPPVRVPSAPEQFHGDGVHDSEVEIVFADRLLRDGLDAVLSQKGSEHELFVGGVGSSGLLGGGTLDEVVAASGHAAYGVMGGSGERLTLCWSHARQAALHRVAAIGADTSVQQPLTDRGLADLETFADLSLHDAFAMQANGLVQPSGFHDGPGSSGFGGGSANTGLLESLVDPGRADADGGRDLARRLASEVAADHILKIDVRNFAGHVYNLQSGDGWYIANGSVVHNCRHSASAYLPGVTKLKTGTEDPEGDKARQRQRALERRIRAEKEQALGALTPEAKKAANAGVRAAQAALRTHLTDHPKLKRLPYREQIGAGNHPGPGGPKGGPVGDMQPPAQPTLPGTPSRARNLDTAVPDRDPSMRRLITDTDGNDRSATVMRHTTEAIDRVHKMPPGMPSIPLNTEYGRNLGVYHRDPTGAPASISIDPAGRYPYLTSAHELGHFLDHAGFPPGLGFSVERQVKPGGLFHEWWKAVVDSDPIQVLLEIKDLRHDGEILVRRIRPDGSVNEVDVNHKHITYLTHPREAFGRSYAQWIATRSDDRRLLADLRLGQDWANGEQPVPGSGIYSGYPHYWDDQGFEPIAAALDEAFRRLGLLR